MRVLLIHPWIHDFAAFDLWNRPLAFLKLASLLEQAGMEVELLDLLDRFHPAVADLPVHSHRLNKYGCGHYFKEPLEKPPALEDIPRRYSRFGMPLDKARKLMAGMNPPDLVITGCTMTYWYPGLQETIREARRFWPEVPVWAAGIYAILCPAHARQTSGADWVYTGNSYVELAGRICSAAGVEPLQWSAEPWIRPAVHLQNQASSLPLQSAAGCPFHCTYCASRLLCPSFENYNWRDLLQFMECCIEQYDTKDWAIYDDALLAGAENHFLPWMEQVIRQQWPVRFHTPNALHCRFIDQRVAETLKKAGFETIRLGLEFGCEEKQRDTGGKVRWEHFEKAMNHLLSAGFQPHQLGAYVLAAYPGQKTESLLETCRRVHQLACPVRLALYSPIPGTADFNQDYSAWRFDPRDDPVFQNPSLAPYRTPEFPLEQFRQVELKVKSWNRELLDAGNRH